MGELNKDRILQKASDIRENITFLRELARRSDTEFTEDALAVRAARYALIVATEAAANICAHILAKRVGHAAETYGHCYQLLADHAIIPQDLAQSLRKMAGFRNLLVHGYGKIDDRLVLQFIRENLADLETYVDHVATLVPRESGGERE